MIKLKKCPVCGSENVTNHGWNNHTRSPLCMDCDTVMSFKNNEILSLFWNMISDYRWWREEDGN